MILVVFYRIFPQTSVIVGAFDMYLHTFVSVSYKESLSLAGKSLRTKLISYKIGLIEHT